MSNPQVEVKVGILHTIAKSIYGSTDGKIREAVANAIDNKASKFVIMADPSCNRLSLFDTGTGITKSKLDSIFTSIGLGLNKEDPSSLSYFGLGLMSIFQLGEKACVYSKSENETLYFEVDVKKIFAKENEHSPISFIQNCIDVKDADVPERENISAISDEMLAELFGHQPGTFTEIIIEDINKNDAKRIFDPTFKNFLRQVLPLMPREDEPFIDKLTEITTRDEISALLRDPEYCQHIDVHFGTDPDSLPCKLYKYFPQIKNALEFPESNIFFHKNDAFACYLLFMPEDLEAKNKQNNETGLWVRNRNFLVKRADNFQRPGSRSKLFTGPVKNWTYGEIFHKNMNGFLTVSRDEYIWDSEEFLIFQDEVFKLFESLNRDLRQVWQTVGKIEKAVVKPFRDISSPFSKAEAVLKDMSFWESPKDSENILKSLALQSTGLESAETISTALGQLDEPLVLSDTKEAFVVIDAALKGSTNSYTKRWNKTAKCVEIRVSPDIFDSSVVSFLGRDFTVEYVVGKEINKGISFDINNSKIRINPFNAELRNYSISFIEFYIAIEVAYSQSLTVDEMREFLIKFVGRNFENPSKYIGPFEDDLRRRAKCTR